jgi:hypothetical protein
MSAIASSAPCGTDCRRPAFFKGREPARSRNETDTQSGAMKLALSQSTEHRPRAAQVSRPLMNALLMRAAMRW